MAIAKKTHHAESNSHVRGVKDEDTGTATLQRAPGDPDADFGDLDWDPVDSTDDQYAALMNLLFGDDSQAEYMSENEYTDLIGC